MTRLALTLALAAAGGIGASVAGLPLPYLIGPLLLVTCATFAGLPLARPPQWTATIMRAVLGVAIGASFNPELIDDLAAIGLTLLAVPLYIVVSTAVGVFIYRRVGGYDRAEAFFAALPGGLYTMTAYAEDMGVDVRRIALAQALRLTIVVVAVPIIVWIADLPVRAVVTPDGGHPPLDAVGVATLVACGVVGALLGRLSRLPGGVIIGPMICSTAVHVSGLSVAVVPWELLALAQVVLGASIGARFVGESQRMIRNGVPLAFVSVFGAGLVTLALAWPLAYLTGGDLVTLLLALAPGGMAEMSLVAVSLGLDAAIVATLHLERILLVVLGAPVFGRRYGIGRKS